MLRFFQPTFPFLLPNLVFLPHLYPLDQPLTHISGLTFATFLLIPALCTIFTTLSTSLYAPGASSATPALLLDFIKMPFSASSCISSSPRHCLFALSLDIALPAP